MTDTDVREIELRINEISVSQRTEGRRPRYFRDAVTVVRWGTCILPIVVVAETDDADHSTTARKKWTCLLNRGAASKASTGGLLPFMENDLGRRCTADEAPSDTAIRISIPAHSFDRLAEGYELHAKALESFEAAKSKLEAGRSRFGTDEDAFYFLQQSLQAGFLTEGGWYVEKLSAIESIVFPARARKNPIRGSTRAEIGSLLSAVTPPLAWVRRPPT